MARDISKLHPTLQKKITELKEACKKQGITIGIGECVRTVAEQDALYAKGRTAPGSIVTNAKGSSYSSMHQWGVAFDFYLIMDVDKDGKTSDDAYNDSTGLFTKVGKIGQKLGLEWGGSWKSIVDKPHFQLPDWGSTTSKLKSTYGTPDKFMNTWNSKVSTAKNEDKETISLGTKDASIKASYTTTSNLNMRSGAGSKYAVIDTVSKGKTVTCNGYYLKDSSGTKWYYCSYGKKSGYMSSKYLKKK